MRAKDEGLVQVCKNAQFLTVKKLGYADYGLADSNNTKISMNTVMCSSKDWSFNQILAYL
jgi:hypothetical protein